jgi:hypothetical protein
MLVNPTLEFIHQRATAVHAILSEPENELSVRQTIAMIREYNQLKEVMRAIHEPQLDALNMWDWYCRTHNLAENHSGLSLTTPTA